MKDKDKRLDTPGIDGEWCPVRSNPEQKYNTDGLREVWAALQTVNGGASPFKKKILQTSGMHAHCLSFLNYSTEAVHLKYHILFILCHRIKHFLIVNNLVKSGTAAML